MVSDDDDVPLAIHKKTKQEQQKDRIKRTLKGSNPCVLLEKSDFSKLVAPKADDEELVKSPVSKASPVKKGKKRKATDFDSTTSDTSFDVSLVQKRDNLRRSAKLQPDYKDGNSDEDTATQQTSDAEDDVEDTPKVGTPKKRGRKSKGKWCKGVIKKKRSKSAAKSDRSSEASTPVPQEEEDVNSESEDILLVEETTEAKESTRVEPDIAYYVQWNSREKLACKLCDFKGRNIINHYRVNHPDDEVFISRLSPEKAKEVIKDGTATDYSTVKPIDLWECKNRRKKFNFECIFCDTALNDNTENFYDHLTSHTGEFRFYCTSCQYKTNSVKSLRTHLINIHCLNTNNINVQAEFPAPPNYNLIIGYICTECNYTQLTKKSVEKHVNMYHSGKNVIKAISMSNKRLEVDNSTSKLEEETAIVPQPITAVLLPQIKSEKDDSLAEESATLVKQEPMEEEETFASETTHKQPELIAPEKSKEKEKDMNIFMCKTDINEENQKIEAERKKKMEEVNEKVKQSRALNFVDQLKSRLDRQKSFPEDEEVPEVAIAAPAIDNVNVTPPPVIALNKKPTANVSVPLPIIENSGVAKLEPETTLVPKNNAPIGNTIQRLQDNLTNKPPPMMSINDMLHFTGEPSNKDVVLFKGYFSIRRMENEEIMYTCSMPACIMSSTSREVFRSHCVTVHSKFSGHTICTLCVVDPPIFESIACCFDHVIEKHWDELISTKEEQSVEKQTEVQSSAQPLLRMRRLSGDLLSEMKDTDEEAMITMDESSGFPFTIASVTSQVSDLVCLY